jgi:hypothetical protein
MTISRIKGNAAQIGQQIARSVGKEQAKAYFTPKKRSTTALDCISDALLAAAVTGLLLGVGLAIYHDNQPMICTTDTDCIQNYGLLDPNDDIEDTAAINADIEEGEQK